MKDFLKKLSWWMIFWVWFLIILWISYIAIKARQATNPNIADDGQGMYATNGSTLTAGKWNEIVDRTPLKVKVMQWTLWTDSTTVAHGLDASKITNILCSCYNWTDYMNLTYAFPNSTRVTQYRAVSWTSTNMLIKHTSICNLQAYKCTIYYLP